MEEILIRVLQERATPAETELALRWLNADPENQRQFQELARLWSAALPSGTRSGRRAPPSAFEIIRAAKERQLRASGRRRRPWEGWGARAAASVALVVIGFGVATLRAPAPLFAGGIVTTSAREMATVKLADGSLVRLGPSSEVRFGDDPDSREVWLDGDAFFSVAPVEDRPFTVRTVTGKAVALGTRFRVRTSDDAMQVGVLDGRVALSVNGVVRELVGGEVGEVVDDELSVRPAAGLDELRSDLGNFLAFRSTPLSAVGEEVGAHFGLPVRIRDPELGRQTVTASFQDASFADVLSVLCRITAVQCTIGASGATIGGPAVE